MSSPKRRVVITGVGLISPLGNTKEALWEALSAGQSGVGPLTVLPPETLPIAYAAEADQFQGKIGDFGTLSKDQKKGIRKALKVMCRECQMGVAAAQLAISDAGIEPGTTDPVRTGISYGSDYMLSAPEEFNEGIRSCLDEQGQFEFDRWAKEGLTKMSPLWLLKYLPNMPASHLAIFNDLRGPNNSITLREASGYAAMAEAYQIIVRGDAETMLTGATGTRLHPMKMIHVVQQEELADTGVDPAEAARPFDLDRTGTVLGEGAGSIVLEELSSAEARGATIYGELASGVCGAAIGPKMVALRGRAMANAMRATLDAAEAGADEVGHLNAHGLGTKSCDVEEATAIGEVFGDRAKTLPVVAAKSNFGNLGAGGGMVELIGSLMAMERNQLFPMLNYRTPDPECQLSAVTDCSTAPGGSFLSVNVTPQGQAAAVMVRRYS